MKTYLWRVIAVVLVFCLAGAYQTSEAQVLKRLSKRAKDKIEENVGKKQDEAIDKAFDGNEEETEGPDQSGSVNSPAGEAPAATVKEEVAAPKAEAATAPKSGEGAATAAKLKPGEGAWANYDFVPGERPIFIEDFGADVVGNFPRRLEFKSGNMEVVEWQGRRWLRAEDGEFFINLPEVLPDRFTMEFEVAGHGNSMGIRLSEEADHYHQIEIGEYFARVRSGAVDGEGELGVYTSDRPVKIRIAMDGQYLKLYADEKRALNVPNADLGRSNRLYVDMNGWSAEDPRMISDIGIMAGGRKLYDAMAADGRVVTQGILFDTGSDQLRPESTPTLKEIGQMLKEHPELRIAIEGHTDNVGSAASNKDLSERRAASVKADLVKSFEIGASRIETSGFGPEKPVAPNDTPEGRRMNRRVELVKL